jgi:predicted GNAT family N-acyltransferase
MLYRYDAISAHFVLTSNDSGKVVATVRLTPYPRTHSSHPPAHTQPDTRGEKTAQNDTALVTSGGGPGGTAGALPMQVSADSTMSPSADLQPPKSDMEYHTGLPNLKKNTLTEIDEVRLSDADIERKVRDTNHGFPLGGPQSESSLAHEFLRKLKSSTPFKEIDGAPVARGSKLSRLAVCKSMRGKGLGALTVKQSEAWLIRALSGGGGSSQGAMGQGGEQLGRADSDGSFTIIISSQMHAKGFYELLGYSVYGEPYDEEGAPHTWCTKRVIYEHV